MKRVKLDPKTFKSISADIRRMEGKHGVPEAYAGMTRYLTHQRERGKRQRAISQLRSELAELESKK